MTHRMSVKSSIAVQIDIKGGTEYSGFFYSGAPNYIKTMIVERLGENESSVGFYGEFGKGGKVQINVDKNPLLAHAPMSK